MRFQSSEDESSSSFEEKKDLLQVAAEVENGYKLVDLKSFSSLHALNFLQMRKR